MQWPTLQNCSLQSAKLAPDESRRFRNNNVEPGFGPLRHHVEDPFAEIAELVGQSKTAETTLNEAVNDWNRK